ncbi:MAG: acyl-CoA dehydrogenase family protein [Anaerolineales bacterium]|nr:MAG: acyl-CoA dehydrogenase family protein [Anaerolineales bacterium]
MNFELSQEHKQWQAAVHDFVAKEIKPKAREVDERSEFNWEAARKGAALGLLGMHIPEEYGGAALDTLSIVLAVEELGWGCGSTALSIGAHSALGCAPVALFGSEELKQTYLPVAAGGKSKLAALALTEPGAGSDLSGGVQTTAVLDGDHWVINGNKMWCTNASIADFIVTLVRTGERHSLILVPTDSQGLSIGPAEKKMGLHGSPTHAVSYQNVRVPAGNLVGEQGKGLHYTFATLDGGRVGIGALSVGLGRAALEEAVKYAKQRKTFGQPIANHQAIQWMLADAETQLNAARLLVWQAAWNKDNGKPFAKEAAMAKLFATEAAEMVCRNAIQIHGGYGYSSEFPVERIYRDARLMTIGEGTSEIMRMVIARHVVEE